MKNLKGIIMLVFLLFSKGMLLSQQIKFNLVLDNQSNNYGWDNSITQDQKGYLWFTGITKGVHRYDGKKMTTYSHNPDNSNSLASNIAIDLSADSTGNIWVATIGYGLDRFNPETNKFTHFRHQPGDPGSLSSDTVTVVKVDRSGTVWVGTRKAVDRFDPQKGTFNHYIIDELFNYPGGRENFASVSTIYEDKRGDLWVGWVAPANVKNDTVGGLARLDKKTGKFIKYKNQPGNPGSLVNNGVFTIYEDSKNNLWIGTVGNGLQILDRATGKFSNYLFDAANPEKLSAPPSGLSPTAFLSFINEDEKGRLWIGSSNGGINMYDPVLQKTLHYGMVGGDLLNRYAKDTLSGFTDSSSVRAFKSKDGLLWIASGNKGIYNINFSKTTVPYTPLNVVAYAFYVEEGKQHLWIQSDSSIIRKDMLTGQQKLFRYDPRNPKSISGGNVMNMLGDGKGNIWLANHTSGVSKFNIQTEQVTHYRHDAQNPNSLVHDSTHILFLDRQQYLWIGTHTGLSRMDINSGKCTNYIHNPKDSTSIATGHINSLAQDKNDRIWIGTDQDICVLNSPSGKFKRYVIGSGQVLNICPDATGRIWATCGGILLFLDQSKDRFKKFTTTIYPEGFDNILGMVEDQNGNLWLSSKKNIIRINKERDAATLYGAAQGVQSETEFWMRNYITKDGRLFLCGNKGYYSFNPDELTDDRKPPLLNFSRFKIGNEEITAGEGSVLKDPIWKTNSIRLTHRQSTISFEFVGVDFQGQGDLKYLYQLENYDNEWRDAGADNRVTFFNLPPGKYVFHVKAVNSDGTVVEKKIAITITPPWWKSWWAYCLYALLLILAGYLVYKYQRSYIIKRERERTQQKELAQAKEIEKAYKELKSTQAQLIQSEKMASLGELTAGIAHEIQNPLNFVNNFSEVNKELIAELLEEAAKGNTNEIVNIAQDIRDNSEKINHHGKRADAIVKGMLQHSRAGSGEKEPTDINALCDEYLRLAYHGLRAKDKTFNARFETDFDASIGKMNILPQDMGRVILNLINNAFYAVTERKKKSEAGYEPQVKVSTKKTGRHVLISVSDNGTGIPNAIREKIFQPFYTTKPTGQGTGLGLSLSYDIVKAQGGELSVETKEGEGSTFIIQIPVN